LTNRIGSLDNQNPTVARLEALHAPPQPIGQRGIELVGAKPLHVKQAGETGGPAAVFIHGLGGSMDYWTPLINSQPLQSWNCLLFDLEGHGLSPTNPLSKLSIASFANDVKNLCSQSGLASATLVAHSMGCLVALKVAQENPTLVSKLILIGPPPNPLPDAGIQGSHARAALVRAEGMGAVVDAVSGAGTSDKTKSSNLVAFSAVRTSLLGQSSEGYAKACTALAESPALDVGSIQAKTVIITGADDKVSPPQVCEGYKQKMANVVHVEVLKDVGHWHVFEDPAGVLRGIGELQ
jgi:pimeloyl-ACP methyl ester carboxylesterase